MRYIIRNIENKNEQLFLDRELFSEIFQNDKNLILKTFAKNTDIIVSVESYTFYKLKKLLYFKSNGEVDKLKESINYFKKNYGIGIEDLNSWSLKNNLTKEELDFGDNTRFTINKKDYFSYLTSDKVSVERMTQFINKILDKRIKVLNEKQVEIKATTDRIEMDDENYLLIDGERVGNPLIGKTGQSGKSLEYEIRDNTLGVKLEGESDFNYINIKGDKGETGENGLTPVVNISEDNFLTVNGEKIGTSLKGEKGEDGITPIITLEEGKIKVNGTEISEEKILTTKENEISINEDSCFVINGKKQNIEVPLYKDIVENIFLTVMLQNKDKYNFIETEVFEVETLKESSNILDYVKTNKKHKAYIIIKENKFYGILCSLQKEQIYSITIPNNIKDKFEENKFIKTNALIKNESNLRLELNNIEGFVEEQELVFYKLDREKNRKISVNDYIEKIMTNFKKIQKNIFFSEEDLIKINNDSLISEKIENVFEMFNLDKDLM